MSYFIKHTHAGNDGKLYVFTGAAEFATKEEAAAEVVEQIDIYGIPSTDTFELVTEAPVAGQHLIVY